ncbi:hypothetical protein N0V95_009586 [Ascochyta clinopodiicola]|nr:hypothetical protein N0V95_009586 [Ascochyta clinopodiicola]
MELPLRPQPQHPSAQRADGRSSEAQIQQEESRFGATHVEGGSVKQGNFVNLTYSERTLPAAKSDLILTLRRPDSSDRAEYAGHFAHVALEPVKAFVLRSLLHDQIHAQLARDAADSGTRTLVVWGLDGTIKTQLVSNYVQQHRDEYKVTR